MNYAVCFGALQRKYEIRSLASNRLAKNKFSFSSGEQTERKGKALSWSGEGSVHRWWRTGLA